MIYANKSKLFRKKSCILTLLVYIFSKNEYFSLQNLYCQINFKFYGKQFIFYVFLMQISCRFRSVFEPFSVQSRSNLVSCPTLYIYIVYISREFRKYPQKCSKTTKIYFFMQKICSIQKKAVLLHPLLRKDGRVVYCVGLENRSTERYRGFESLSFRKKQ